MKKLLIIITLFVSSFFFISIEDAKAYDFTKDVDFSLIDEVLLLKEKLDIFIETDTTYSDYYLIYYDCGNIYYYLLSIDGSTDLFTTSATSTRFVVNANQSLNKGSNLINISLSSSVSNQKFYIYENNELLKNDIILYSNFDLKYTYSNHTITYFYQDFSYIEIVIKDNKVNTLYDLYLEYNKQLIPENPHQEEIDKVTSFYTMVIEKIEYLANEISTNYILLFVIGIFIVTFIFLLIFRRFL